jgi:DNA ligase-1
MMQGKRLFRQLSLLLVMACLLAARFASAAQPPISLAQVYDADVDVRQYWVSEKLDGVRAYWDGAHLWSRRGNRYHAPEWFVAGFPPQALDGELWIARGQFEKLLSVVRDNVPDEQAWRAVRFMVFDLPSADEPFTERLGKLKSLLSQYPSDYLQRVAQFRVADQDQLMAELQRVVAAGGEGLMLRRADSLFKAGRSADLLKLKPYFDAEARVMRHLPGRGKYIGKLGALLVETPNGVRFRLGSGFSDAERADPPPIGAWVTYKYHGLTDNGVPRFASFLRIRTDP